MPEVSRVSVRLTGIPLKYQGTHDSLCAYYAAAMLLCALRPEFEDQFEAAEVARDPLFANYPRRPFQRLESLVAAWTMNGANVHQVTEALNRACARSGNPAVTTAFAYRTVSRAESTVDIIRRQID